MTIILKSVFVFVKLVTILLYEEEFVWFLVCVFYIIVEIK